MIEKAQSKLKAKYIRRGNLPEHNIFHNPLSDLTVHHAYTDLFIVEETDVREAWQEVQASDNQQHLKLDEKLQKSEWRKINIEDIIDNEKRSAVLAGIAGYGKTFLMEYLCNE